MRELKLISSAAWARRIALASLVAIGVSMPTQGAIIDRPFMKVEGVVIVWGADATSTTPIVSDFIIEDGGASTDLISGDVFTVLTGTLDALDESYSDDAGATLRVRRIQGGPNQDTAANGDRVTDASDSFTAFGLRANTDVRTIRSEIESSFYVASNKAFNIDAVSSAAGDPADLNLIRLQVRVTESGNDAGLSFGTNAQLPHSDNSAIGGLQWTNYRRLSNLTGGQTMFTGNRRTAEATGDIASQSVRFDQTYRWNTGNIDLADGVFDVEAEVEYTVYIP